MAERVNADNAPMFKSGCKLTYHGKPVTQCTRAELIDLMRIVNKYAHDMVEIYATMRQIDAAYIEVLTGEMEKVG